MTAPPPPLPAPNPCRGCAGFPRARASRSGSRQPKIWRGGTGPRLHTYCRHTDTHRPTTHTQYIHRHRYRDKQTHRHTPPTHTHRHTAARLDMCHRPSDLGFLICRAGLPLASPSSLSRPQAQSLAPGGGRDGLLPHRRLGPGRAAQDRPLALSRWLQGPSCFPHDFLWQHCQVIWLLFR